MRLLVTAAAVLSSLTLAQAEEKVDGKVNGLNPDTFASLKGNTELSNPISSELNASVLLSTINKLRAGEAAGVIDEKEKDLLLELTQSAFRKITVTLEGRETAKVETYPTSGAAKRVLLGALEPAPDLEAAWSQDDAGFATIVKYSTKSSAGQRAALNFVKGKFEALLDQSNKENAYKPLRDELQRRRKQTGAAGSDDFAGRVLLYKSMRELDFKRYDDVPDMLYNWLQPANYADPLSAASMQERAAAKPTAGQ